MKDIVETLIEDTSGHKAVDCDQVANVASVAIKRTLDKLLEREARGNTSRNFSSSYDFSSNFSKGTF